MGTTIGVYCSTCFALPGEPCRTKFIVYGANEVMPVLCLMHHTRLLDNERDLLRHLLARQILAVALTTLRNE